MWKSASASGSAVSRSSAASVLIVSSWPALGRGASVFGRATGRSSTTMSPSSSSSSSNTGGRTISAVLSPIARARRRMVSVGTGADRRDVESLERSRPRPLRGGDARSRSPACRAARGPQRRAGSTSCRSAYRRTRDPHPAPSQAALSPASAWPSTGGASAGAVSSSGCHRRFVDRAVPALRPWVRAVAALAASSWARAWASFDWRSASSWFRNSSSRRCSHDVLLERVDLRLDAAAGFGTFGRFGLAFRRSHEPQPSALRPPPAARQAAVCSRTSLAASAAATFAISDRRRNAQDRARAELVDVAVECFGIRAENRDHCALDPLAVAAGERTRDAIQRVAAHNLISRFAISGGRRRSRLPPEAAAARLGRAAGAVVGAAIGWRRGTVIGGEHCRRIEQHRVFAEQAAARPIHVDQERDERLADRIARANQQDAAPVLSSADAEFERTQERRAIEAVARKNFRRGEVCIEGSQLLGGRGDEIDFRRERLIERRTRVGSRRDRGPRPPSASAKSPK